MIHSLPSEVHSLLAETDFLEKEIKNCKPIEKDILLRYVQHNLDQISKKLEELKQYLNKHDDLEMKQKYEEFFQEYQRLLDQKEAPTGTLETIKSPEITEKIMSSLRDKVEEYVEQNPEHQQVLEKPMEKPLEKTSLGTAEPATIPETLKEEPKKSDIEIAKEVAVKYGEGTSEEPIRFQTTEEVLQKVPTEEREGKKKKTEMTEEEKKEEEERKKAEKEEKKKKRKEKLDKLKKNVRSAAKKGLSFLHRAIETLEKKIS